LSSSIDPPPFSEKPYRGSLALGLFGGCAAQIVVGLLFLMSIGFSGKLGGAFLFTIWVWLIPVMVIAHRDGQPETVKGLLISCSIGFLLSAACGSMMFSR
jgi:hypothetical protein